MSEKISSLFDNEVEQKNLDKEISALSAKSGVERHWKYYQVVRDVLQNNYTSSPDLSARIMDAIDKEPTQISGFPQNSSTASAIASPLMPWKILAYGCAFLAVAGILMINVPKVSYDEAVQLVQLVQEDIPVEFMEKHYATTALNANYFIKAQLVAKD